MPDTLTLPAGTWPSPLTPETLASASIRLAQPCCANGNTYWVEGRPAEKGRSVLVECNQQGTKRDLTPAPFDVRSQVHEYGGSAYLVVDTHVFFVNAKDQGIYRVLNDQIECVFQQTDLRFANLVLDAPRERLLAIAERHSASFTEPQNFLASVCLNTGQLTVVHEGADFYSSPALNADGSQLAFLTWNHPNMPWDRTALFLGTLSDKHTLSDLRTVSDDYAAFSPMFGPDNRLYFVLDANDWWNLYVALDEGIAAITDVTGELGMPHWIFGMSTYGFADEHTLVAACTQNGLWHLLKVDLSHAQNKSGPLDTTRCEPWEFTAIDHLSVNSDGIVCHAASPTHVDSIVRVDLENGDHHILQTANDLALDPSMVSCAEPISFGQPNATAYGFYYAPKNGRAQLPANVQPPLIVMVHGGPTTATSSGFNPRIQFWTTRGFAVLDVNYRGSTGFGRRFRHSLNGQWGTSDVEDCINGAQLLIDRGDAHPDRVYIMGGSAGGYTVLSALTFTDFFAGGISSYGIGDLALLCQDTHKFEARYTDSLVAPFEEKLYRERSPLFSADQIRVPVLFFQGTEDKMVPQNQAQIMVQALRDNRVPVGYVLFDGEGHGFRRVDSIITLMNTSLHFYLRIMGEDIPADSQLSLYNEAQLHST